MDNFYNKNGLIFWTAREIAVREMFRDYFARQMEATLKASNNMWRMYNIEAPLLTPKALVNKNYSEDDIFVTSEDLVLRPETTPGSYQWLRSMFDLNSDKRPPICVWQAGKSFRREQDQPTKFVRLKEFYQQEFQCVFTADSANDYHTLFQEPVAHMIRDMVGLPTRIVKSDRLPSYSNSTVDVEVLVKEDEERWMEVCSMSLRTDFPGKAKFTATKGIMSKVVEKDLLVAEIAIGLDRCVWNFVQRTA